MNEPTGTAPSRYRWSSIGGHLALDLCNTVSWRLDPARTIERLMTPDDLVDWFSTISGTGDRDELRRQVRSRPTPAEQALLEVRALREATFRIIEVNLETSHHEKQKGNQPTGDDPADAKPVDEGRADEPEPGDVEVVSMAWRDALAVATVGPSLPWHWTVTPAGPSHLVHTLALSIAELLQTPDLSRLRRCDGDGCGWLFLDTTRNRSRRWCDPLDCGNRARVRAYSDRHRSISRPGGSSPTRGNRGSAAVAPVDQ